MLKSIFRQLLKFILVIFVGFSFVTTASAASGAITGNNSFATAYPIGYWKYATSTICKLDANQSEAYFKFTTNANDRVFANVTLDQGSVNRGVGIQIFSSSQVAIDRIRTEVVNPTSVVPFIFANVNSASSQTFYIKVTRGSYAGDFYFPVAIQDRISTGSGTFNFAGIASNAGNPNILTNPNGVDSSIIYVDLTTNTTIPRLAIVKSITTDSTQTPNQGNVTHRILSDATNVWYTSTVSSATYGSYSVASANLDVARKWSFRYNAKAKGASTMKNVKATIQYEFDKTNQFQY